MAMLLVPWYGHAQHAQDYTLSTGVDSTKWIALSTSALSIDDLEGQDDETSGCIQIGFTFNFAGESYTQFSCNTNGRFRLGSTACSYYWQLPFTTMTDTTFNDLPFITALGMDNTLEPYGTQVRYELVGTAPNRILVVEYITPTVYDYEAEDFCTYQIQLLEGSNIVRLVYGSTDETNFNDFQIGIAAAADDYLMIDPTTHATTIAGTSTSFDSWPGLYRYYELTPYIPPCPRISHLMAFNIGLTSADLSWSDMGDGTSWLIEYGDTTFTPGSGDAPYTVIATDTFYTLTDLQLGTTYEVYVRAICGSDSSSYVYLTFTTPTSMPATVPFICTFEESGNNGWDLVNGTQANYWMVGSAVSNGGSQSLYITNDGSTNGYNITSTSYVFATRTINLNDTGYYAYSFDWKCQGESSYDFIRAALVPASTTITAGQYNGFNNSSAVPTGGIALDGAQRLNLVSTWQTRSGTFHLSTPGSYMWVIMWRNDPSAGTQPPAAIDNVMLMVNTCPQVNNLTATNVTSSSVTVNWTAGGTETSWIVSDGSYIYPTTTTSYTITGLQPNTDYNIMVAPVCSGSDTGMFTGVSVRTDCGPFSVVPFVEDFESAPTGSYTSNSFINCWHRLNNGTTYYGYPYVANSTTYNHTPGGSKGLYWYNTTTTGTYGDYQFVILPAVDTDNLAINTLRVSFWAKSSSTSYYPSFSVGVMDDPTDESTFHLVSNINVGSNTTWRRFEVDFQDYTSTGSYIAIRAVRPTSSWYAYVDDITVDLAPDCPAVTNLVSTSLSDSEVELTWTERGDATTWDVEYGEHGFTLGEGTIETATSLPHTISGLDAGTTYDVYVTPTCDGVGDHNMITVVTDCADLDSLPYTMGFENADGVTQTGSSTNNTFVNCWRRLNNGSTYFGYPYVASSSTYNHTPGGSRGLYWFATTTTDTYGDYQTLVLPPFDTTLYPVNTLRLTFWAKSSSASYYPEFQVGVMTNPLDNSTFRSCGTVRVTNLPDWYIYNVSLANYNGNGKYVALRAIRPSSSWYAYVDDITLELQPDCPEVTNVAAYNITDNTATLRWTDRANTGSYIIEYGPYGFTRGTGSTETVTSLPHTLTGLSANTQYDVYISPNCTGSTGFTIYRFTTECDLTVTVPFTMGFETSDGVTSTGGSSSFTFVNCWHRLNNGTMYFGYPYVSSSSNYNHTPGGSRGLYWYNTTTTVTYGDYAIVVLPPVDPTIAVNSLQFKFWAKASSSSYYPQFQVGVMTDPNNPNTFRQVGTVDVGNSTQWEEFTTVLGSYNGTGRYVALRSLRSSSWYAYVDDITLELAPSCPQVMRLDAPYIGTTGAQITWQDRPGYANYPSQYEIQIIPSDTAESVSNAIASSMSYVITGLQPTHTYTVLVRGICASDDYGAWSDSLTFTTSGMPCLVVDTANSFTATIGTGTSTNSYIPSYSTYNYGLSQQIYKSSEIGGGGNITSISVMPSAISQQRTYEIYMAHTSSSSLSGFIHPSDMIRVYDGDPVTLTANTWITFNLDTPFPYNGSDNLLVCFRDMTGSWVSGNAWYVHSTSENASCYVYQDASSYDPFTQTGGTLLSVRNNIKIEALACDQLATCAAPTIMFDSSDADFISVSWIPGNDETAWNVEYRDADSTTWHDQGTVNVNQYTFTGLNANRLYEIRITSLCTDSNFSSIITARTPCAGDTLPFFTSFETFPNSSASAPMPPCWVRNNNYSTSSGYPYGSTSYAHNGSYSVYMYSSSTSYSYFSLPPFAASIDSLSADFWLLRTTTSNTQEIKVGVMTDPYDIATFTEVATIIPPDDLYTWGHYEVYFDQYQGDGRYIAFLSPSGVNSYPYLDELTIDYIPECRRIQNVEVTDITTTSALVSWPMGEGMEFDVVCVPSGTDPDSGNIIHIFAEDTVTIFGLHHSTSYTAYVRGFCYPDTSQWSMGTRFFTGCGLIDTLPYFNGFETEPTSNSNTNSTFVRCWTRLNNGTSYGGYPYISSSSSYNHTPGGSKGFYWYNTNTGGSYGSYAYIILPEVDTNAFPINSLQLSFWAKSSSTSYYPVIEVGVMESNEDTAFHHLRTINLENSTTWQHIVVPLGHYSGPGSFLAVRSLRESGLWYAYLDDFTLDTMPSCPMPLEIVFDSVGVDQINLSWVTSGSESQWQVTVTGPGFSGLDTIVNDTTLTVSGLSPSELYTVGVKALCGMDESSDFTYATIRTECITINTLPYTQNFEGCGSYSSNSNIFGVPCWDRLTPGATYFYPYVFASTTYNHTPGGNTGLYWYGYTGSSYGSDQIIVLPPVDTTVFSISQLQLAFWVYASTNQPYMEVGVLSDLDDQSFVPVDTVYAANSSTWELFEVPLANYHGRGNRIAVRSIYNGNYWYGYLDDFSLDTIPSCLHVGNLHVTASPSGSITVGWTERGTASEYQVAIDTVNVTPTSGVTIYDTTSYTFTGLVDGSDYYIWVRAICGPGDTSHWEGPIVGSPNSWNMRLNAVDTIYMCGGQIYDDGGPTGSYSNSHNSTLIIYPDAPNSLSTIQGSYYMESCCDYIEIYDGAGTTGQLLYTSSGTSSGTISTLVSESGPITLFFHTDGSVTYDGFALRVGCESAFCRVINMRLDTTYAQSDSRLAITWDSNEANLYEVEYGAPGFALGTGTTLTVTSNHVVLTGLSPLTNYEVYVRSICSVGDTGSWSHRVFKTAMCGSASIANSWSPSASSSTTSYGPIGYSCYNYSYTQMIIDSAQLAALDGDISGFAFKPYNSAAEYGSYFTGMDVYMANVSESVFTSDFIHPDTTTHRFVQVLHNGNCNFTDDNWQTMALDTSFTWDGHSNLLISFNRSHGTYNCSAEFEGHSMSGNKSIYVYNDNSAYNVNTVSGGTRTSTVGDLQLISCGLSCEQPLVSNLSYDFESATVSWTGEGLDYEVNIKETSALDWPSTDIHVTGYSYTFSGLNALTGYTIRVRQDCSADEIGYSEWTTIDFVTDSLPCLVPDSLTVSNISNNSATFDWRVLAYETMWDIHVWNTGGIDSIYTVASHPATVGGFSPGVTYNAAVRPLCGQAHDLPGDWGDTIQFTTLTCPDVTGLSTSGVTESSVTLNWTADPMAQSWLIEYGFQGFAQGTGISVTTTTNSYIATGLDDETAYDFYVKAVCGTDWNSEGWTHVSATTLEAQDPTYTVTVSASDPSMGTVSGGGTYRAGETCTVTATPNAGFEFVNWSNGETANPYSFTVVSNITLQAIFAPLEGIDDINGGAACSIYPNPTSSSTTISVEGVSGEVRISVVDMSGRTVRTETLECSGDCQKTMEVEGLAQGTYFVRITADAVNLVRKLVVR